MKDFDTRRAALDLVTAFVNNNNLKASELPGLLLDVYGAISEFGKSDGKAPKSAEAKKSADTPAAAAPDKVVAAAPAKVVVATPTKVAAAPKAAPVAETPAVAAPAITPKVSIKESLADRNHIISLITGEKLKTLKPGTTNRILNCLKVVYNTAVSWEVEGLTKSPLQGIKQFNNNGRRERFLSKEEAASLLKAVLTSRNKMLAPIVAALLLTGCRKREILDARWDCVDLDRGILIVPISKSEIGRAHV